MKAAIALWLRGDRARTSLAAARADLAALPLPEAVARRVAVPAGRKQRDFSLRLFRSALASLLDRESETHPCLVRALALLEEARACGYAPSLVVGVRGAGGTIESHAWLAIDGVPFLEAHETPERYETIAVLPERTADTAPSAGTAL